SMLRAFRSMVKELKLHPSAACLERGDNNVSECAQGQDIFVGNVGDSRAVLATRDNDNSLMAVQLTVDLKSILPSLSEELLEFISVKEGFLHCKMSQRLHMCGCQTVTLQVWQWPARAFGDFCLKDFGLISVPDVYYHHITERDEFVLLASDGVLDVLSNKEAVDIVASAPSRATAGRALVDCATRAWRLKYPTSKNDNCAIVCLYLMRSSKSNNISNAPSSPVVASHVMDMDTSGCGCLPEGSKQSVRKFRIALLFTEYEAFKMKENEALHEMITVEEQVEKVSRVLPKSKWNIKVTAIREANKDLADMTLDELVGNLRTYEMEIDGTKELAVPEDTLALKTCDSYEEIELDEKQVAFITKNFSTFFKKKKGTGSKKWSNDNPNGCYKCAKIDHKIWDCPVSEIE
ncbi:putative protein phosphatase 2C 18, partial [Capsicum annuum]